MSSIASALAGAINRAQVNLDLGNYLGPTDPGQNQFRQVVSRRLSLRLQRLYPPRGLRVLNGALVWEIPQGGDSHITHYNIYIDDDRNIARQVGGKQHAFSDRVSGTRFWVRSYNSVMGVESPPALYMNVSASGGPTPVHLGLFSDLVAAEFYIVNSAPATPTPIPATLPAAIEESATALEFFIIVGRQPLVTHTFDVTHDGVSIFTAPFTIPSGTTVTSTISVTAFSSTPLALVKYKPVILTMLTGDGSAQFVAYLLAD